MLGLNVKQLLHLLFILSLAESLKFFNRGLSSLFFFRVVLIVFLSEGGPALDIERRRHALDVLMESCKFFLSFMATEHVSDELT